MVDPARLRTLLGRIADRRERLESYGDRDLDSYLDDEEAVAASKYLLVTTIEDVLSVANHIIASEGWRSPADYADAFVVLRERGLLSRDLAERLASMARFRNLLVHVYAEVDDARVHRFLERDLGDLDGFSVAVLDLLSEEGAG